MSAKAGWTGYKPVPKYEEYLADQIEAVPTMRQYKREYFHRELKNNIDDMERRAEAAGVGGHDGPLNAPVLSPASLRRLACMQGLCYMSISQQSIICP